MSLGLHNLLQMGVFANKESGILSSNNHGTLLDKPEHQFMVRASPFRKITDDLFFLPTDRKPILINLHLPKREFQRSESFSDSQPHLVNHSDMLSPFFLAKFFDIGLPHRSSKGPHIACRMEDGN